MGIYVIGMHRSGTSVLARTVGLLVGYEGHRGEGHDNIEGHWELPEVNRILEGQLAALHTDWASPPAEPLCRDDPRLVPHFVELDRVISSLGTQNWVLKDPRLCLALAAIVAGDSQRPLMIATYRDPIEVGRSMNARDGVSVEYGIAVWETYTSLMVQQLGSHDWPTLWLSYNDLMVRPVETIEKLAVFLQANDVAIEPERLRVARAAINPRLRNQQAKPHPDLLLPNQRALLELVSQAARTGTVAPLSAIPAISSWARALIDLRQPYVFMERDNLLLAHRLRPIRHVFRGYDHWRRITGRPFPANDPFSRYLAPRPTGPRGSLRAQLKVALHRIGKLMSRATSRSAAQTGDSVTRHRE